jgi:cyclopropane fatty-acyl-phospholipid synthase-like methyltransferase
MTGKIRTTGWNAYSTWEHSQTVKDLYRCRCLQEAEEMTCHAQAAELLQPLVAPGDSLLDVGCGSGYFFHSLKDRKIPAEYFGIDSAPSLVRIGHDHMPRSGLAKDRLQCLRIEDFEGEFDHVVCMNVLTYLDNFHRPLERMLKSARKTVLLRESAKQGSEYLYVTDKYLDGGIDLKTPINAYDKDELKAFIRKYGFDVKEIVDRRSGGKPEMVIDYPHYWTFFLAERRSS